MCGTQKIGYDFKTSKYVEEKKGSNIHQNDRDNRMVYSSGYISAQEADRVSHLASAFKKSGMCCDHVKNSWNMKSVVLMQNTL